MALVLSPLGSFSKDASGGWEGLQVRDLRHLASERREVEKGLAQPGQFPDLEAYRLDQSEEERKGRWRSGQTARGGQTKRRKELSLSGGVVAVRLSQKNRLRQEESQGWPPELEPWFCHLLVTCS